MSYLGQAETTSPTQAPDWAAGVAAIVDPLAKATSQAYSAHLRTEIDEARIKAGLEPVGFYADSSLPIEETRPQRKGLSTTSLLLGLAVLGSILYIVTRKR